MELIDINTYRQILGSLIKDPSLFLLYSDINGNDFGHIASRVVFLSIQNLFNAGVMNLSLEQIHMDIPRYDTTNARYKKAGGIDFFCC